MLVDIGACKSVIHIDDYNKHFYKFNVRPCNIKLKSVSGEGLSVVGAVKINISNVKKELYLVVIRSDKYFAPIIGRNWLTVLFLGWQTTFKLNAISDKSCNKNMDEKQNLINLLKCKYKKVFSNDRSTHIVDMRASLKLKEGSSPIFHGPYSIPYSKKKEVEAELLNLEKSGIIQKVRHSEWASPIVIVQKKNDKKLSLCRLQSD